MQNDSPSPSHRISLILGGARSGKSTFAEQLAHKRAGDHAVLYVATLEPFDGEMQARVVAHQAARPTTWRTVEAPYTLADSMAAGWQQEQLALVDCLTVWTSNLLLRASGFDPDNPDDPEIGSKVSSYTQLEQDITAELTDLIQACRLNERGLIMVSNEVGMGLVPPYPMGRAYRDMLGRVNQRVASLCDEVFMVLAGMAVDWKALSNLTP